MSKATFILISISYYIFSVTIIIIVLSLIKNHYKKKYQNELNELERNKNLIISASILSELNKVETLINNDELKTTYDNWQERFKKIKDEEVPQITDKLIEIEDLFHEQKYKKLDEKISKIELEIYNVKTHANFLLNEIKELTQSEEKNREIVTKLKTKYREILTKYNKNKVDYKEVSSPLELQFENVDKLFSAFEIAMENSSFTEIGKIVKALDDTIGNLEIIVDEAPTIIILGKNLIPKKMKDIEAIEKKLTKDGYLLDYLNISYNIKESNKKISDIFAKLNVLNVEDSIFELRTMLNYFDSLYNDFDKEKISRKLFEELSRTLGVRITKLLKTAKGLVKSINELRYSYDLTNEDVTIITNINKEIESAQKDYDIIINSYRSKTFAYSKLARELEHLNVQVSKTEEKLDISLRTLGSLKEDELRAREQLDEIKAILKQAKEKINSYNLPVIPKNYYIELSEANDAIKEMIKELEKQPISIKILNTRVDTARDLVLKLFNTTNEIVKTAYMAEMAIVYGNRYRPVNKEIDFGLTKAENLFFKGNFKSSLENAITSINVVEPGIYKRLIESYGK